MSINPNIVTDDLLDKSITDLVYWNDEIKDYLTKVFIEDEDVKDLETKIGYEFKDKLLLKHALLHRSRATELCKYKADILSNERLEFLGDSLIGWISADIAFHNHKTFKEGGLTDIRKALVSKKGLMEIAVAWKLERYIQVTAIDMNDKFARRKTDCLSDCVEAIVAAVYLDSDSKTVYDVMRPHFEMRLPAIEKNILVHNYKNELQEWLARRRRDGTVPSYTSVASGPRHNENFTSSVSLDGVECGTGLGNTRKEAEQAAAKEALIFVGRMTKEGTILEDEFVHPIEKKKKEPYRENHILTKQDHADADADVDSGNGDASVD